MRTWILAGRILCLTLIAYLLAEGVFLLYAAPRAREALASGSGSRPAVSRSADHVPSLSAYDGIGRRNLLGALNMADVPEALDIDALPESRLGWKLLGTIMSEDASLRRVVALINGKQEIFRERDAVNNWIIDRIDRGAVVLAKGEAREVLRIEAVNVPGAVAWNGKARQVARRMLQDRLSDITALARDVSVSPATVGTSRGMRVTALRQGSLMQELGLVKGDVLLSANAAPVASFADLAAIAKLVDGSHIELTVFRNNQEVSLRYEIKE